MPRMSVTLGTPRTRTATKLLLCGSGALGKEVWVLLDFSASYIWLVQREDSPWYPTMRLFRQPVPGDWPSVIGRVVKELRAWTSSIG